MLVSMAWSLVTWEKWDSRMVTVPVRATWPHPQNRATPEKQRMVATSEAYGTPPKHLMQHSKQPVQETRGKNNRQAFNSRDRVTQGKESQSARLPASTSIDFQFLPRCPERGLLSPLFTTCCKITQRKLMLFLSHQDYFGKRQDQAGCEAVSKSEMNTRERAFCDIIKG